MSIQTYPEELKSNLYLTHKEKKYLKSLFEEYSTHSIAGGICSIPITVNRELVCLLNNKKQDDEAFSFTVTSPPDRYVGQGLDSYGSIEIWDKNLLPQ